MTLKHNLFLYMVPILMGMTACDSNKTTEPAEKQQAAVDTMFVVRRELITSGGVGEPLYRTKVILTNKNGHWEKCTINDEFVKTGDTLVVPRQKHNALSAKDIQNLTLQREIDKYKQR